MSRDEAGACLCGIAVALHYNARNEMKGCAWAAQQLKPVDKGKLFGLKLQKNHEARQMALKSIHQTPAGWRVRIGGAVRGHMFKVASKAAAEQLVHDHFNEQMLAFVEKRPAAKP